MSAPRPKKRRSSRLAWAPILVYLALTAVALYLEPDWVVEPTWLLPVLNLVFRLGVGLAIALLAARAYLQGGSLPMLALGGGMCTMGVGTTLSVLVMPALEPAGSVAIHNLAVLVAGALLVAAALGAAFPGPLRLPGARRRHLIIAYGGLLAVQGLVVGLVVTDLLPPFFVQGLGPTPLRQLVLGIAIVEYLLSALFFGQARVRTGFAFFRWYALGQLLFAVGLAVIFQQHSLGGLVNWAGRWGQFLGGVYLMAGLVSTVGEAQRRGLAPAQAFGASLLQAGLAYRPLVESTSDAVIVLDPEGQVLYWNHAAHRLFGYEAVEVFGREFLGCVQACDPRGPAAAALPRESGTVELELAHRAGARFPAEVSVYRDQAEGIQTVCVVRDVTERKRADAALRQANETLEARVAERTAALRQTNADLRQEMEERKRAEAALRESEHKYRDLIQSTNSAILRWTADGTITFFNEYAETFFGYRAHEIVGQPATMLLPKRSSTGEDLTPLAADIAAHPDRYATHVNENVCRDGRRVWMAWTNRPICNAQGHVVEMVGVGSDITERKRAEEALRQSEARLTLALRAGRSGTFDWDAAQNRNLWSDELLSLYGLTREEFGGRSEDWIACLVPEDRAAGAAAIQRSLETGVFSLEFRIRRRDTGEVRWMHGHGEVFFDAGHAPVRMIGINVDITERKRAEAALAETKALLEAILEQAADGILVRDAEGRLLFANAVARAGARAEPAGTPLESAPALWGATFESDGRPLPVDRIPMSRALRGEVVTGFEFVRVNHSGERVVLLGSAAPVRNREGALVAAVAINSDITERKRAEETLRASLAEKEAALATNLTLLREVHHRVKNNLQMLCDVMYLQMEGLEHPEEHQDLQDAYSRVYAIARLHEHMYRAMQSGRVQLAPYLGRLVEGYGDFARGVHLAFDAEIDPQVSLDMDRAVHAGLIVNELVTNALKHAFPARPNGQVAVRLRAVGDQLELQVRDNGRGLPAGLELATAKSLGLRIVHILAQRLQAAVHINDDHGVSFTLRFPLHAATPVEPRHD